MYVESPRKIAAPQFLQMKAQSTTVNTNISKDHFNYTVALSKAVLSQSKFNSNEEECICCLSVEKDENNFSIAFLQVDI